VSIAPDFHENERLEWNWNEVLSGVEIVPFNPMEAMGALEAPMITEPLGSPRPIITGASEGTRGSLAPISPIFDP
jgi:hypothetical protein